MEMTNSFTPFQRFVRLLKRDKKEIRNIYVYALFNGLIGLSLPLGIQAIINLIQGGRVSMAWAVLVGFVVAGVALTGVLNIMQLRISENLQQRIFARAAMEFAFRIPRLKMEELYRHYAPELVNRFFDIINIQKGLSKLLIEFSSAALQVIFGLILLSLYHPFFIVFGLVLTILVLAIFMLTAKSGLRTALRESKHKYKVVHRLEEIARTAVSFKLSGNSDLPLKQTDLHVNDYLEAREKHFGVLMRQAAMMVGFKLIVAAGLLIVGGMLVMDQKMNIGQFVAAEIIVLLIMSSVEKLIMSLDTIYDVLTSLEKVGQVTDLEVEKGGSIDLTETLSGRGVSIDLRDVRFSYPDRSRAVLDGINLSIRPGEKLAVTGTNASGKSTLLQLLAGLYPPETGHISFNGFPRGNLAFESLRTVMGDSLSQELIFEGTVIENVTMGRAGIDFHAALRALEVVELTDYVQTLTLGYDTILEPQGKKLSASIMRRILLARGIAGNPSLLLIEDDFEEMDNGFRQRFFDFITEKDESRTVVIVSNDAYVARKCDRILVLDSGKIKHEGPFEKVKNLNKFRNTEHA